MKKLHDVLLYVTMIILLFQGCSKAITRKDEKPEAKKISEIKEENIDTRKTIYYKKLESFKLDFKQVLAPLKIPNNVKIETVNLDTLGRSVVINCNKELSFIPFRENNVREFYSLVKQYLGSTFENYSVSINSMGYPIEDLIPNYYRISKVDYDTTRMPKSGNWHKYFSANSQIPIVHNVNKPYIPTSGLFNRNIALWHSHGWYFNNETGKWEWQRPRLFQTVEDLVTMSFTIPYLIPMLENAGANVFVPRERDIQSNEVVIDNDTKADAGNYYIEESATEKNKWHKGKTPGFAVPAGPLLEHDNPFRNGTNRYAKADSVTSAKIDWIPDIPEKGEYTVYISYPASDSNITDASYTVYHDGGKTEFLVNQTIGGGTWIYLGKFKFDSGYNPASGKVTLINKTKDSTGTKIVSADAVRFGGGMGIVSRNGMTSGRPKFAEASRYYLQYAGMPDSLVYNFNNGNDDYEDDYQDRGEYVNYLIGAPYGPNVNRKEKGLGIPIDLSLALHTDAGTVNNDTTFGTLAIYCIRSADSTTSFPNGMSRLANRDLADMVQSQVIDDIHAKFDTSWKRRPLREAQYSEAYRPNVPSVLLEMFSHQNFLDMKFMHDPRFRFTISRSIYKALLKFIALQNKSDYVVQPLPVDHFQAILNKKGNVNLKWQPVSDPLEKTAIPDAYVVYTRKDDGGFDNGVLTDKPELEFASIQPGVIYSYKVTAVNKGGESFPSEILSVCRVNNSRPLLIVNGFDRICGPAAVESRKFTGFLNFEDAGIADRYDLSYTGAQFNFDPNSEFKSNDAPGHGASFADYEDKIIAGNSFDYPYIHGSSIKDCGYSFCSASDEAVWDKQVNLNDYKFVDIILGKEKETSWQRKNIDSLAGKQFKTFPDSLKSVITAYTSKGGNIFVSGSYIGTDLCLNKKKRSSDLNFANNVLKINLNSDHASRSGRVVANGGGTVFEKDFSLIFNTELNSDIYAVESPDAIVSYDGAHTILRYDENKLSAAVAYKKEYGAVVFGFPFETIKTQQTRNRVMKNVLHYLGL